MCHACIAARVTGYEAEYLKWWCLQQPQDAAIPSAFLPLLPNLYVAAAVAGVAHVLWGAPCPRYSSIANHGSGSVSGLPSQPANQLRSSKQSRAGGGGAGGTDPI